jgi:hypothetical protein
MEGPPASAGWSATQPAPEPFVFRSGGRFGGGKKVLTIGEAVEHMDRHPEDGIYHLRNGTLAQWLDDQEAFELADLARQVAAAGYTDPRVLLETFLLGTGLVPRPRLVLRPKELRMGYILAGQSITRELQIRKGRGRGYLFGRLHRAEPWLSLDPMVFSGRPASVTVTADSRTLPISKSPHEAQIMVESSGSEQPVVVPVRFRVMGVPSRLNRFLIRPLVSLLAAGLIGAGLGWLLALSGVGLPSFLPGLAQSAVTASTVWAIVIGLLWALLGGIRGLFQPIAWPAWFTLRRWLLRTLVWAIALVVIAVVALGSWRQLDIELGLRARPIPWDSILIAMLALAVLPGILGEIWNTRGTNTPASATKQMPVLRPGIIIAVAAAICALILIGAHFGAPLRQKFDAQTTLASAQERTDSWLSDFDATLNNAINRLYIRLYDRRAPAPTPTVLPKSTP